MALPEDIAALAENIVNTLTHTVYQHTDKIDPAEGVYDCDCNGFVAHVLKEVAPANLAAIPINTEQPGPSETRPRAFEYYDFLASLTSKSTGAWSRINLLSDAGRGDVMAWRHETIKKGQNTGHVVILAETPRLDASGAFYVVRVYDSTEEAHFEDTRPSPKGKTGVGSGFIHFKVDGAGRPIAYLFSPPLDKQFDYLEIAIGRARAI